MQGRKDHENKLFYAVELNQLVPADHAVRRIREVLDLGFLYGATRQYYSHEGKPSIDPVVLFKIYLVGYLFGVSSERQLFREIQVNMAYRWYLGYDLDEEIPHHSIMTKSRYRFPVRVFDAIFKRITALCRDKGLISGDYHFVDSTLVRADASKDSFRQQLMLEEEYLKRLRAHEEQPNDYAFSGTVDPEKMGKRRRRPGTRTYYRSTTDEDAEMITRPGKGTFPAYKAHLCVDRKCRVVLSVDASAASADDMSRVHSLFTQAVFAAGKKPRVVVADKHYGGIEALKYYQDQNVETCILPRLTDSHPGKFLNTDFSRLDQDTSLKCPAGRCTTRRVELRSRMQFRFAAEVCNTCALKSRCTACDGGRIVSYYRGDHYDKAAHLAESAYGKRLLRARQIIVEGVIGEAKTLHLLNRCRYRRLDRLKIQLFLTGSAVNLKRLMKEKGKKTEIGVCRAIDIKHRSSEPRGLLAA